jgi:hypothetical protein
MFVAQRELKYVPLGTNKVIIFKPGDQIPDFEEWNIHARRAHLNLEWVAEVSGKKKSDASAQTVFKVTVVEEGPAAPKKKAKAAKKAKAEPVADSVPCPVAECGRTFKSPRALSTHAALAHK